MPVSNGPGEVLRFLRSLHQRAEDTRPDDHSIEEITQEIGGLLDFNMNLVERTIAFIRDEGMKSFEPRDGAADVLKQWMPAEEADARIREIDGVLKIIGEHKRPSFEFWTLGMNLQTIRSVAARSGDVTPMPLFDSIGHGQVHAMVKSFGEHQLLVFQSGTKAFTNLFSKAFVSIWLSMSRELHGKPDRIDDDYVLAFMRDLEATAALQRMMHAYLFLGRPWGGVTVFLPEGPQAEMAGKLEIAIDLFMIGHEYAHILHAHESDTTLSRRDKELAADKTGLLLMLEAFDRGREDFVIPFSGAYLIIVVQEMIMRTVHTIVSRPFDSYGYPRAIERCVNLLAICGRAGILTPTIEQVALGMGVMLTKLYSLIEPALIEEGKQRRLSNIWIPREDSE